MGLLSIFYAPGETYEAAGKRPWLVPLVVATLLAVLMNVMVLNVIGMGTIVRNSIESNPRTAEQLGPERVNEIVRNAENSVVQKSISYTAALVAVPIIIVIAAGVTLGGLLVFGGTTNFAAVMGAVAWATYAGMAVRTLGTAVFLAAVTDFQGVDPQNLVMLNASIFFDPQTSSKAVRSLASGIDLIAFWTIYLQSVGLAKLSQLVTMGQALTVSIGVYALFILIRAGFAMLF
jgi:hypothetical protein